MAVGLHAEQEHPGWYSPERQIHFAPSEDDDAAPVVEGDTNRLRQVIDNLINNALTYTPEGGSVTITARQRKDSYEFDVADTGIGMKKSEIPRIFERFYRIDKDRSRNSGGTGLGLAIVKHLVEAHEGTISVHSKQGKGTTFTVSLKSQ